MKKTKKNLYNFTKDEDYIIAECLLYIAKGAIPEIISKKKLINNKNKISFLFDRYFSYKNPLKEIPLSKEDLFLIKLCIEETLEHEEFIILTSLPEESGYNLIKIISKAID